MTLLCLLCLEFEIKVTCNNSCESSHGQKVFFQEPHLCWLVSYWTKIWWTLVLVYEAVQEEWRVTCPCLHCSTWSGQLPRLQGTVQQLMKSWRITKYAGHKFHHLVDMNFIKIIWSMSLIHFRKCIKKIKIYFFPSIWFAVLLHPYSEKVCRSKYGLGFTRRESNEKLESILLNSLAYPLILSCGPFVFVKHVEYYKT